MALNGIRNFTKSVIKFDLQVSIRGAYNNEKGHYVIDVVGTIIALIKVRISRGAGEE